MRADLSSLTIWKADIYPEIIYLISNRLLQCRAVIIKPEIRFFLILFQSNSSILQSFI